MIRYRNNFVQVTLLLVLAATTGCRPQQPIFLFEDGDLDKYIGQATKIEYPDVDSQMLDDVAGALPPLDLLNSDPSDIWDLSLEEAMRIALANSKVIRTLSVGPDGSAGAPTALTTQPDGAATIYDPARTESDPRFGVEAALAAFDAQFSASCYWEKNDTPANVVNSAQAQVFRPTVLDQDLGTFQARLQKYTATGGIFALTHNVRYEASNLGLRQWPSDWNVNLEGEMRQPLLQGAGVAYNRIDGPGAIPGYHAGVLIARIRDDIALVDFEAQVRELVRTVESTYSGLYLSYRRLDAAVAARDATLQAWRQSYAEFKAGGVRDSRTGQVRGSAQDEAQSRSQYLSFRAEVESSLSSLYRAENRLRFLLGIAATDGRLIRPSNEPSAAKIDFDWYGAHAEALTRSVELRRQKWRIKQRELELTASKNYLLPRLDLVGRYRWLGLGDHLLNSTSQPDPSDNAYQSFLAGNYQEWQLGLDFSMPLGFRKEMAGVQNAKLNLMRERAILQNQELAVSHQLADAWRDVNDKYKLSQTHFNRRAAAEDEVKAVTTAYEGGTTTLNYVLDAQSRRARAENDYYTSLVEYNLAVTNFHYRKGSLLEYNGVFLAEGPWPAKAYFDAHRRARARDASMQLNYGFTLPSAMSRGPIQQMPGAGGMEAGMMAPVGAPLEPIPAPLPDGVSFPSLGQTSAAPPATTEKIAVRRQRVGPEQPVQRDEPGQPARQNQLTQQSQLAQASAARRADSAAWHPNVTPLPPVSDSRATSTGWSQSRSEKPPMPPTPSGQQDTSQSGLQVAGYLAPEDSHRSTTRSADEGWVSAKSADADYVHRQNPSSSETTQSPSRWAPVRP